MMTSSPAVPTKGAGYVRDCDSEDLVKTEPALVGHPKGDVMRCRRFEVEQGSIRHRDLACACINSEPSSGVVGERIGQHRTRIRINARHRADHRTVRGVLRNRSTRQRRAGGRLVDVVDGNGEHLVEGQST